MLLEIYSISYIFFLTDSEAFFMQSASDRGYCFIIEYLTQPIQCICV